MRQHFPVPLVWGKAIRVRSLNIKSGVISWRGAFNIQMDGLSSKIRNYETVWLCEAGIMNVSIWLIIVNDNGLDKRALFPDQLSKGGQPLSSTACLKIKSYENLLINFKIEFWLWFNKKRQNGRLPGAKHIVSTQLVQSALATGSTLILTIVKINVVSTKYDNVIKVLIPVWWICLKVDLGLNNLRRWRPGIGPAPTLQRHSV